MSNYQNHLSQINKVIIATGLIAALSMHIAQWQPLKYANYALSELCALLTVAAAIALAFEVCVVVYLYVKIHIIQKTEPYKNIRVLVIKNILTTSLMIIAVGLSFYMYTGRVSYTNTEYSVQKYIKDRKYFIVLQGEEYEIYGEVYEVVCVGTPYSYRLETSNRFGKTHTEVVFLQSQTIEKVN